MRRAAGKDHENIVRLMLKSGETDFNETMNRAIKGGHENIV